MDTINKLEGVKVPEWLSTHPDDRKRQNNLDSLMPSAIETRKACNCPPLPKEDPRIFLRIAREKLLIQEQEKKVPTRNLTDVLNN